MKYLWSSSEKQSTRYLWLSESALYITVPCWLWLLLPSPAGQSCDIPPRAELLWTPAVKQGPGTVRSDTQTPPATHLAVCKVHVYSQYVASNM